MQYKAYVTYRPTGEKFFKTDSDFRSKTSYAKDLRANEFIVHRVEIAEVYDFVIENTNCEDFDYEAARLAFKNGELTLEGFHKAKDLIRDRMDFCNIICG